MKSHNALVIENFFDQRDQRHLPRIMLASDIDNTLMVHESHRFLRPHNLVKHLSDQFIPPVYISGAARDDIIFNIQKYGLPAPAAFAPFGGTELWLAVSEDNLFRPSLLVDLPTGKSLKYEEDAQFRENVTRKGFDRHELVKKAQEFIAILQKEDNAKHEDQQLKFAFQKPGAELAFLTTSIPPDGQQFKLSFSFLTSDPTQVHSLEARAEDWFEQTIVIAENIAYNNNLPHGEKHKKYALDAVPLSKAGVVQYLQRRFSIDAMIVAGDSGNDLAMLTQSGDVAIVVGGATPALIQGVRRYIEENHGTKQPNGLYAIGKKLFYIDESSRLGPESILYALTTLGYFHAAGT